MKLLTAGGLLFSAVSSVATDSTDAQGNEGTFELYDYVLTVDASQPSTGSNYGTTTAAVVGSVLTGIGYNPVVT